MGHRGEAMKINRTWASHVKGWLKRWTSKKRRRMVKRELRKDQGEG